MLRRLRHNSKNNPRWHYETHLQNLELEWAHVFHDSLRGNPWLQALPLNIGRWAGNYSFFYVLCRLLSDFRPATILEFGLGESSKVVSTFLENSLTESTHTIIEENSDWQDAFENRFSLCKRSCVNILPCVEKRFDGAAYRGYDQIERLFESKTFDLYIVDGPTGSEKCSRFDIVTVAESLSADDEFIILVDDYNRAGEQETVGRLLEVLREKGITIHVGEYVGKARQAVIATNKYRFSTTL
jgi:hypothetical protein